MRAGSSGQQRFPPTAALSSPCQRPGTSLCLGPAEDIPLLCAPGQGSARGTKVGVCPSCHSPCPAVLQPPLDVAPACGTRRSLAHLVAQVVGDQPLLYGRDAPVHHVRGGHDVAACRDGQDRDVGKHPRLWRCREQRGEGRGALPVGARPSLFLGLPKAREWQLCESRTGVSLPGAPHLLWHKPAPPLPAAGS